jgi:hypothetical protein
VGAIGFLVVNVRSNTRKGCNSGLRPNLLSETVYIKRRGISILMMKMKKEKGHTNYFPKNQISISTRNCITAVRGARRESA